MFLGPGRVVLKGKVQAPPVMKYQISRAIIRDSSFICQLLEKSSGIFIGQAWGTAGGAPAAGGAASGLAVLRSSVFSAFER